MAQSQHSRLNFKLLSVSTYFQKMLHLILFNPEIPQNTGNIGRMCAITRSRLHLIHPLGFTITDAHLRRSGMDYWKSLDVVHHENWDAFWRSRNARSVFGYSRRRRKKGFGTQIFDGDGLVFGNEGHGAPAWLHDFVGKDFEIKIPQPAETLRSLNLSTAAGIATYEALRQITRGK